MAESSAKTRSISFIVFAEPEWDSLIWTNPQHIASRLAKSHCVLYVQVPLTPFHVLFSRKRKIVCEKALRQIERNLHVFTPRVPLPHPYRWPQVLGPMNGLNLVVLILQLRFVSKQLGLERNPLVLWFFSPRLGRLVGHLGENLACYHCTDEYSTMPFSTAKRKQLAREDDYLTRKADLVFTTAPMLYERKKAQNQNTYYVPNAADFEHFAKARSMNLQIPQELQSIPKPIIGFIGAVDEYKVDLRLIEAIACARPDWNVVLVGPIGAMDDTNLICLPRLPNIHYLGHRDYMILPAYLGHFDVCIIPYKLNDYTATVFPLKFFEYLAAGKPVVSTNLPSLQEFNRVAYIVETVDDFITGIERSLSEGENQAMLQKRLEVAQANSWDARVQMLEETVRSHLARALRSRIDWEV